MCVNHSRHWRFMSCHPPPGSFANFAGTRVLQASLTAAALFASYIAQQRLRPFVAATTLSNSLQVRRYCHASVY